MSNIAARRIRHSHSIRVGMSRQQNSDTAPDADNGKIVQYPKNDLWKTRKLGRGPVERAERYQEIVV